MTLAEIATTVFTTLGLSRQEALQVWTPFAIYIFGVVLYSIFVYKFYRFVARRDVFELDLVEYARGKEKVKNIFRTVMYGLQYVFLFPVLLVAWFVAYTFFLSLVGGARSVESLLLVSMVLVSSIRITSYYTEDLSKDLAKSIPFAILGIFIVDGIEAIAWSGVVDVVEALAAEYTLILYYLGFTIILELLLRGLTIAFTGEVETVPDKKDEVTEETKED